jgi:polysaccharide biosynthesis protein PslG
VSGRAQRAIFLLLWIAAVAALILPRLGDDAGQTLDEVPSLPNAECPGLALGVHSTLAFEGDGDRRTKTIAAIDDALGAQVVRDSLLWHQIEPAEGERDWSRLDAVVAELRDAGIEPILAVLGSPSWVNGVPDSTPDYYLHVPARGPALDEWLERYSHFLAEAVERYRDFVRRWEIWNEPNLAMFWRPRPDPIAYRQVYETLRATILRVDPGAEVAVGGLAGLTHADPPNIRGRTFLSRFNSARPPLENVAVHPYTTNDHAPNVDFPGENNFSDIARVRGQLASAGEPVPIWVTEWGWPSDVVGAARQAQYVDTSLTMLERRYPFVPVATYFADRDRPPDFSEGLLEEDLDPKPAALVFRAHAERLTAECAPVD